MYYVDQRHDPQPDGTMRYHVISMSSTDAIIISRKDARIREAEKVVEARTLNGAERGSAEYSLRYGEFTTAYLDEVMPLKRDRQKFLDGRDGGYITVKVFGPLHYSIGQIVPGGALKVEPDPATIARNSHKARSAGI